MTAQNFKYLINRILQDLCQVLVWAINFVFLSRTFMNSKKNLVIIANQIINLSKIYNYSLLAIRNA